MGRKKQQVQNVFCEKHPDSYLDIVKAVVNILHDKNGYRESLDPGRITIIDYGNYQGTILFIIGEHGYQPSVYWYVKVDYGSCSGCDTLKSIHNYSDQKPTEEEIKDYMTLALHILQGLKLMD